jgi:outer membrane protein TolC
MLPAMFRFGGLVAIAAGLCLSAQVADAAPARLGGSLGIALAAADDAGASGVAPTPTPTPTPIVSLGAWAGAAEAVDLPTLLARAVGQTPALARARLDVAVAQATIEGQTGIDDWRLSAGLDVSVASRTFAGIDLGRQTDVSLSGSLLRALPSGGTIGLHASTALSDSTMSDHVWTDSIAASISHPLLRGYGRDIARADQRRARIARGQAELAIQAAAITAVQAVVAAYWELVYAERELAITQSSLDLARERLRITQAGIAGGKIAPSEALAVEQIIATRQEQVLGAELSVLSRSISLRRAAAMPVGPNALALSVQVTPADAPPPASLEAALADALAASPELAQLALADEDARIAVELADNGLLPQLDASLRFGPSGRGTVGRAAINMVTFDEVAISGSITLEHDLGGRGPEAATRSARLSRQTVMVSAEDVRAQLGEGVARALAQAELARQRLGLSRQAIDLAMRNIGVEQSRFDLGKATSFDVLARQDELRSAQLREARAQIDGQLAQLSVRALTGEVLDDYGVVLPEASALPATPTPAPTPTSGR